LVVYIHVERRCSGALLSDQRRRQKLATKSKVLCIEDDKEMMDLLRLILESKGFDFVGAEGGREGLDRVRAERPDLILLDLMMPDIDGWQVYRQLKADDELQSIPVIVVTVRTQGIDEALGLHLGEIEGYITKPFSQTELLDSINRVLGKD
jgi:two-component system response regulator VicR